VRPEGEWTGGTIDPTVAVAAPEERRTWGDLGDSDTLRARASRLTRDRSPEGIEE
jgi:hypothetical protein